MEWTLEDVEETSRLHPESFFYSCKTGAGSAGHGENGAAALHAGPSG
ncbi:hypothetical protein ACFSQ7_20415 [Paenibacillus rhizoplanae]